MKYLMILLLFVSIVGCSAQNSAGAPEAVIAAFQQKYPQENSPKWEVDANGNYEAGFKVKGEKYRADFAPSGYWIETENSIKYKELPDAIQKAIEDEFDKDDITEIERVEHYRKGLFYDVEFKRKGKNKDIEFNSSGQIIGTEG